MEGDHLNCSCGFDQLIHTGMRKVLGEVDSVAADMEMSGEVGQYLGGSVEGQADQRSPAVALGCTATQYMLSSSARMSNIQPFLRLTETSSD